MTSVTTGSWCAGRTRSSPRTASPVRACVKCGIPSIAAPVEHVALAPHRAHLRVVDGTSDGETAENGAQRPRSS